jgi:hypothetical protein
LALRQNERFLPTAYLHPESERQTAGPLPLHWDFLAWRAYERRIERLREADFLEAALVLAIIINNEKKKFS